ncbi:MAG: hypothetical protein K1X91_07400 [Bacteriodetes bacterium]|nr:hypothetical protein [Bacteroidota bacterium]
MRKRTCSILPNGNRFVVVGCTISAKLRMFMYQRMVPSGDSRYYKSDNI